MRTIDMEMVMVCGITALVAALGMVMGMIVILGVQFGECNAAFVVGSYFAMSGLLWGILMLKNYDKMVKL